MTSKNNSENVFQEPNESDIEKEDQCDDDDDDEGSLDDVKVKLTTTRVQLSWNSYLKAADVHAKNDNAQTPLCFFFQTRKEERKCRRITLQSSESRTKRAKRSSRLSTFETAREQSF